jgi:hypothetical protein
MAFKDEIKQGLACNSVDRPESVIGRAACLIAHPGRMLLFPFLKWFETRYAGRYKFARAIFAFDLMLLGAGLALLSLGLYLSLTTPTQFEDEITFHTDVAPQEIVSGAPSTLTIQFVNRSDQTLRDARLALQFPDHFQRQEIMYQDETTDDNTIRVGTVEPGSSGSIKIRGVMFGDVGGEQVFESILQFKHGPTNKTGYKIDQHVFSPSRSTLELSLDLPDRLIAGQPFDGLIEYYNNGPTDFPRISIEPDWPETFELQDHTATLTDEGHFSVPAIEANSVGEMRFTGTLGDEGEAVDFVFHPSFTFGETTYRQETLTHSSPIIPPQLDVQHSVVTTPLRAGGNAEVVVSYENVGDAPVTDVELGFENGGIFFPRKTYTVGPETNPNLERIEPGDSGTVTVQAPLRRTFYQSEAGSVRDGNALTTAIANYTLEDGDTPQTAQSRGTQVTTPVTTPVQFSVGGHYVAPTGDQLGRGPLPPKVGETTTYWVFWGIRGSFNPLRNVSLEAELAPGVQFNGRQTVSIGNRMQYDSQSNVLRWSASEVPVTLLPETGSIGGAFAVSITPTADQVGSVPQLVGRLELRGVDAKTGATISATGPTIDTSLPDDPRAAGNAEVIE